jgi:flagellar hook-associated protein FlgK
LSAFPRYFLYQYIKPELNRDVLDRIRQIVKAAAFQRTRLVGKRLQLLARIAADTAQVPDIETQLNAYNLALRRLASQAHRASGLHDRQIHFPERKLNMF